MNILQKALNRAAELDDNLAQKLIGEDNRIAKPVYLMDVTEIEHRQVTLLGMIEQYKTEFEKLEQYKEELFRDF